MSHGFELLADQHVPELNTRARLYRHLKTGAELLSLENDDENKSFGITFRTPPEDSTGLPHILEHSVLCGSHKYPVKEPFVQLLKSSVNTFLNAITFSDKTSYPFASTNLQDFYNLLDVYIDAVFYPRITPETLMQQGWHYELEDSSNPLIYKGVVFNEMKGALSSPEPHLARAASRGLFPDTIYANFSGGDPVVMPDLTYEQFRNFYDTFYHPSNALIYFYGDDDPEERLRRMDGYLSAFERRDVNATVELQTRFDEPRRIRHSYPSGEDTAKKAFLTVNWMLGETVDLDMKMAFTVLNHILLGTPASPLRKALLDSRLGEDVTGGGYSSQIRQTTFGVGLKNIDLADADRVESLVLETLRDLAQNGIDPLQVEASLNTIEFNLRENNTGQFPRGLALLFGMLPTWQHGGDPIRALAFEAPLQKVREQVNSERFFENLIRQHLLDNPHRVTVLLEPDPEMNRQLDEAEKERLALAKEGMAPSDVQAVLDNTRRIKALQDEQDTPEALASIPSLRPSDIERENKPTPLAELEVGGVNTLYHDLFTNGIVYLDVAFDLRALPADLLPLVNLFGRALIEMGTESEDFVRLSQRIGSRTGGITANPLTATRFGTKDATAWLVLRAKSTVPQVGDLLAVLRDILLTTRFDNPERFLQLVLRQKAGKEASLVPSGHQVVFTRLASQLTEAGWVSEQINGIDNLLFTRELAAAVEQDWPSVLAKLEAMRTHLITQTNTLFNVTLDAANWQTVQPQLAEFAAALPEDEVEQAVWSPEMTRKNEGLTIPAQVNYVAMGGNLYDVGYQLDGSAEVIWRYLRTTYLWDKIRVQGGAYGGFCVFDRASGVFSYLSYRDPNLLGTMENYRNAAHFLHGLELSDDEVGRAIIGAIGDIDAYQLPDAKGYSAMQRYLTGDTDAMRQQMREELLTTTMEDFYTFAQALEALNHQSNVVVLGSNDAVEKANAERDNFLTVQKVL